MHIISKLLSSLWRMYVGIVCIPAVILFIMLFWSLFEPLDPNSIWLSFPAIVLFLLVVWIRTFFRTKKEPHH